MFWPLADFAKDFRLRNWWLASEIHVTNNPTVVELHVCTPEKDQQKDVNWMFVSPFTFLTL